MDRAPKAVEPILPSVRKKVADLAINNLQIFNALQIKKSYPKLYLIKAGYDDLLLHGDK